MDFDPHHLEDSMLNALLPRTSSAPLTPGFQRAALKAGGLLGADKAPTTNWFASSLELQRGLFVQELNVEEPDTDWLAYFGD